MANAKRDGNFVPTLIAVSSLDGITPVLVYADPITHRLLTSSIASVTLYTETPSGAIDGVNTTYTTLHTISNVYGLYLNGAYVHPSDYTASGAGFTMTTAIPSTYSGLPFTIVYS